MKNFVVFLGEAQPQKSRLSERGTSEFRDFGGVSLRKTRNCSPERKNKTIYQPSLKKYAKQLQSFLIYTSSLAVVSFEGQVDCLILFS